MSLITALVLKKQSFSNLLCLSKKKVLDQTWNSFNTKFGPQLKNRESSYQVSQILAIICELVALILG